MDVTDMEDRIDQAARRTAINLMRMLEAVEHRDAEGYSPLPTRDSHSPKYSRHKNLDYHYEGWFESVAVEPEAAEEVQSESGSQRLNMEDK